MLSSAQRLDGEGQDDLDELQAPFHLLRGAAGEVPSAPAFLPRSFHCWNPHSPIALLHVFHAGFLHEPHWGQNDLPCGIL